MPGKGEQGRSSDDFADMDEMGPPPTRPDWDDDPMPAPKVNRASAMDTALPLPRGGAKAKPSVGDEFGEELDEPETPVTRRQFSRPRRQADAPEADKEMGFESDEVDNKPEVTDHEDPNDEGFVDEPREGEAEAEETENASGGGLADKVMAVVKKYALVGGVGIIAVGAVVYVGAGYVESIFGIGGPSTSMAPTPLGSGRPGPVVIGGTGSDTGHQRSGLPGNLGGSSAGLPSLPGGGAAPGSPVGFSQPRGPSFNPPVMPAKTFGAQPVDAVSGPPMEKPGGMATPTTAVDSEPVIRKDLMNSDISERLERIEKRLGQTPTRGDIDQRIGQLEQRLATLETKAPVMTPRPEVEPPAKPRVIPDWVLQGVTKKGDVSVAWVKGPTGIVETKVGETLGDLGVVKAIQKYEGDFVVMTDQGLILRR